MPDLTDRLAQLGHNSAGNETATHDTVVADRQRGETALRRRTMQRGAIGIGGVAAIAAAVALSVSGTSSPSKHQAADRPTAPLATHAEAATPVAPTHPTPAGRSAAIRLVSYDGPQRAGFTVASVPSGYVLQGVTGATLDIAEPGDHSSLNSFVGKLTVSVEASSEVGGLGTYHGTPVKINGEDGIYSIDQSGVSSISYEQGDGSGNLVTVQCWSNITLTQDQLIEFAQGVTVTADVQRSHG